MATARDLANQVFDALTGPDQSTMTRGEKEALRCGLDMLAMGLDALCRIADAAEALQPPRPSEDGLHAL